MAKKRLLILCTGNSARSQMAEGLFRQDGGDSYEVFSAGTRPSSVRPEAIAVMVEIGIDISGQRSKSADEFVAQPLDLLITVCDSAKESCPVFPGRTLRLHWPFEDPAQLHGTEEERKAAFRKVRDQIRQRIRTFLDGETTGVGSSPLRPSCMREQCAALAECDLKSRDRFHDLFPGHGKR